MGEVDNARPRSFLFLRNGEAEPTSLDWNSGAESARQAIAEALNAKNVAFLLGAGCSSLVIDKVEVGISTMAPLAQQFCSETFKMMAAGSLEVTAEAREPSSNGDAVEVNEWEFGEEAETGGAEAVDPVWESDASVPRQSQAPWRLNADEIAYLREIGVELDDGYDRNLERFLEVLYNQRFVLRRSKNALHWPKLELIEAVIEKVQTFLWVRVTDGAFAHGDTGVRDLYERFYRKLVLRDRSLPRPWVFTTNYDVFNETAMDRLGIPYANGFTGVVERRFNPASFRYALAEQLDVGSRKWTAVDAFVYLCKLHGSISWSEDDHGLFPIREKWPADGPPNVLIYPTPAKQNASLASPYADLFREFQSRIVRALLEYISNHVHLARDGFSGCP